MTVLRRIHGLLCRQAWKVVLGGALVVATGTAWAASSDLCAPAKRHSTQEQARLLLFSQKIRQLLESSGRQAAIVSRAGTSLDWLSIRYTHAGISLRDSPNTAWSVRQLYYACDEAEPHIYDQGLTGFFQENDGRDKAFASIVLLPPEAEQQLVDVASRNADVLAMLGGEYSANAYAFSTQYQNCNQWLAEMLARAWGDLPESPAPRQAAQQWLRAKNYMPATIDVKYGIVVWAGYLLPLLHNSDQPRANLRKNHYAISLPDAIEAFVHTLWPQARRIELCQRGNNIVTHESWAPLDDQCAPSPGDTIDVLE